MVAYINARRKRMIDDQKMLAQVGYSGGVLGSMAFAKRIPRFDEVFKFPEETKATQDQLERSRQEMIAFAINANRRASEEKK